MAHATVAKFAIDPVAVREARSQALSRRHRASGVLVVQRVGTGTATTSSPSMPMKSSGLHVYTGSA